MAFLFFRSVKEHFSHYTPMRGIKNTLRKYGRQILPEV